MVVVVGVQTFPKCPSLYTILLQPQQRPPSTTCRFALSSSSTNSNHHEYPWKLTELQKFQRKPVLTRLSFGLAKRVLVLCSNIDPLPSSDSADSGMLFSHFGELGLNEKEAEVVLEKNSALSDTSIDSIRAKIASFKSLGLDDFEISMLISKRPKLLTSIEIDQFIHFVLNHLHGKMIAPYKLRHLFSSTDPILFAGFDQKVNLLVERGVPEENMAQILNGVSISKAFCRKSIQDLEQTLAFLTRFGGIELVMKRPSLLNYDLESQLVPRVEFFVNLSNGDDDSVGIVLGKLPAILNYSLKHFRGHVEFFKSSVCLSDEEVFKLIQVYPSLFSASIVRKLAPRIEFLKQCNLDPDEMYKFLMRAPLFLSLSFDENIAHKLVLLTKIGYRFRTKDLTIAIGSVTRTSCKNVQDVIDLFVSYGLSSQEIFTMSKKHPPILQYSREALEKKMSYLIEDMGREVKELLAFPAFLGYKLDDRIKARYESLKEIYGTEMSINKLLTVSTERFSRRKLSLSSTKLT